MITTDTIPPSGHIHSETDIEVDVTTPYDILEHPATADSINFKQHIPRRNNNNNDKINMQMTPANISPTPSSCTSSYNYTSSCGSPNASMESSLLGGTKMNLKRPLSPIEHYVRKPSTKAEGQQAVEMCSKPKRRATKVPSFSISNIVSDVSAPARSNHVAMATSVAVTTDLDLTSVLPEELDETEAQRLRINSRERKRMHDLNSALEELRSVMPLDSLAAADDCTGNGSNRKLSKIGTLRSAKTYIESLQTTLVDLQTLVNSMKGNSGRSQPPDSNSERPTATINRKPTPSTPAPSKSSSLQFAPINSEPRSDPEPLPMIFPPFINKLPLSAPHFLSPQHFSQSPTSDINPCQSASLRNSALPHAQNFTSLLQNSLALYALKGVPSFHTGYPLPPFVLPKSTI